MADDEGLEPTDEVTQYGRVTDQHSSFKCQPPEGEMTLSLILGRASRETAVLRVLPFRKGRTREDDAVRYSTAGKLTNAGFVVKRRPLPWFPEHLDVEFPGTWDDDICELFHSCFGETVTQKAEDG
jgi:hypothetical protein